MLEAIIYDYLKSNEKITNLLTSYDTRPAIFNLEAPTDMDEEWGTGPQYPRMVYELSMQDNSERKTSGTLSIDFFFAKDGGLFMENVEPIIRNEVNGCFFSDETDTIAAQYQRTDPFSTAEDAGRITGFTVTFDVMAFPPQFTAHPDPVHATYRLLKELFPESIYIGVDNIQSAWKATDEIPAMYCRLHQINPGTYTGNYNTTWFNPVMQVHFFSETMQKRISMVKTLIEIIQQQTRIFFENKQWMFVQRLAVTTGADPLKTGQVTIEATYGVVRKYPEYEPMNHAIFNKEE